MSVIILSYSCLSLVLIIFLRSYQMYLFEAAYFDLYLYYSFKTVTANPSFSGNRYVLNKDTAVMLLMDSKGKIAGIQAGVGNYM